MNITPAENYGASLGHARIYDLEAALRKMPQVDCPVRNIFANGLYAREVTMPAGAVVTGVVHKTEHITILSKGRVRVIGGEELTAPCLFISKPGTKNAVWVIEEAVWTTIHANPTNEQDMDVIVPMLTTSKNSDLLCNRLLNNETVKEVE